MVFPQRLQQLACALLLLVSTGTRAVTVADLHVANVPVAGYSAKQLQAAERAGLEQVLVKVSGGRAVLDDVNIEQALAESRRFLQRYQYLQLSDGSLSLEIYYDAELVGQLLSEARQPLWTANRPALLIWLVVDDLEGRRYASAETHPQLLAALQASLTRRGVPGVYPLYDIEDNQAASVQALWQLDALAVYRASQRYDVANMLVGRMTALSGGGWMGDWLFLGDGERLSAGFYGEPTAQLAAIGVDFVADAMAARYAIAAGSDAVGDVLVRIDGLRAYDDYRKLMAYLESIEVVASVYPVYVDGAQIVVRVRGQADAVQMQRIISLNRRLQRQSVPAALPVGAPLAELVYRWNP